MELDQHAGWSARGRGGACGPGAGVLFTARRAPAPGRARAATVGRLRAPRAPGKAARQAAGAAQARTQLRRIRVPDLPPSQGAASAGAAAARAGTEFCHREARAEADPPRAETGLPAQAGRTRAALREAVSRRARPPR